MFGGPEKKGQYTPYMETSFVVLQLLIFAVFEVGLHWLLQPLENVRFLQLIFFKYADTFSRHKYDLGLTDLIEARIPVGDALLYAKGLRNHPRAYFDLIDREIQAMIEYQVIEVAQSQWASNIVPVLKKNGTLGITVDLRKLNEKHKPYMDKFPLSRIDQCIDALANKRYFCSLDVSDSFHQIPIHPDDRHGTSFISRKGQFQSRELTQGFASSPSIYCRLMAKVSEGLQFKEAVNYVDDVIGSGYEFEDTLHNLKIILQRFQKAKLKLGPAKCTLFAEEVEFCGQLISQRGRRIIDESIACLKYLNFPRIFMNGDM